MVLENVSQDLIAKTEPTDFGLLDPNLETKLHSQDVTKPSKQECSPLVLVQTLSTVKKEWAKWKKEEDIKIAMEKSLNPKVKIKVKDGAFKLDTIRSRLDACNIKTLEIKVAGNLRYPELLPRQFFSDTYGGNPQQTFPQINPKRVALHGFDNFMYLNLDYNPQAPMFPGSPGLFFESSGAADDSNEEWTNKLYKVITRLQSGAWEYQGEYRIVKSQPLSIDEWLSQKSIVRRTWATKIWQQGWGQWVRARIFLRTQHNRNPTDEEVEAILNTREDKFRNSVTQEEIMTAYNRGQEKIGVWCMECILYDEAFQKHTVESFSKWVPKPKAVKKAKVEGKDPGRKKLKHVSSDDSSDSEYTE